MPRSDINDSEGDSRGSGPTNALVHASRFGRAATRRG